MSTKLVLEPSHLKDLVEMSKIKLKSDLPKAVEVLVKRQNLVSVSKEQYFQLECIIFGQNSLHQLPTGSGKTWAAISAPDVLDILRDSFGHKNIPLETRVLYIVPLVAIIKTLECELCKFGIKYDLLDSEHDGLIKSDAKVIIVTPEKLVLKGTLDNIVKLSWSALIIDEPQYMIIWGTSKKKKGVYRKPFREAFQHLNKLNVLGAPFELHTATAKNCDELFSLLGRKDSTWIKQILIPERANLTYYLVDGGNVKDIKQFKFVTQHFEEDNEGVLLIYVQKLEEGSKIFFSLNEYATENGLIRWSSKSGRPERPVALLHANLTAERKQEILNDTVSMKIKILIATSSIGAGVNLPVKTLLGWGLDPEVAGIVQASGRVARKPILSRGNVIWVHNVKLGIRIPSDSLVRELLKCECLRLTMNTWFAHGLPVNSTLTAEDCCSSCMRRCSCVKCKEQLQYFEPCRTPQNIRKLPPVKQLSQFLLGLRINENTSDETPHYEPTNLAEVLIGNILEFKDVIVFKDFLSVFSLGDGNSNLIFKFIEPMFEEIGLQDKVTSAAIATVESSEIVESNTEHDSDSTLTDTKSSEIVESNNEHDSDSTVTDTYEDESDEYFDETDD